MIQYTQVIPKAAVNVYKVQIKLFLIRYEGTVSIFMREMKLDTYYQDITGK